MGIIAGDGFVFAGFLWHFPFFVVSLRLNAESEE
jgi:hypothetical protein